METLVCTAHGSNAFLLWLVTSIDTRIVFPGTSLFSRKLMKSVVSLRYEVCCLAIG